MTMTGAELAVLRYSIGMTLDDLAAALKVHARTVRSWEQERGKIPPKIREEMLELLKENEALTEVILIDGEVEIPRTPKDMEEGQRPKGWWVAATARAILQNEDLTVTWYRKESE